MLANLSTRIFRYRVHDGWPLHYDSYIVPLTYVGAENLFGALVGICLTLRDGEELSWPNVKELQMALSDWKHFRRVDYNRKSARWMHSSWDSVQL